MTLTHIWDQAFLQRRPSVSLGLFRMAVAWTVGAHMIPSFFHMEDNYLSTAFKTQNGSFFPAPLLQMVAASPDWLVWIWAGIFCLSLASLTLGLFSQLSCIILTLACYYFYALNNYHIGTLSFDILLVTLVLMCATGYHGDFLSIDSLRRGKPHAYKRLRPFFVQRLLQLQLAWTYWHTVLNKFTGGGNWIADNPYYYLMHYPAIGVVREFPLRGWLGQHPTLCYWLGIVLLVFELTAPLLWFIPPPVLGSLKANPSSVDASLGPPMAGQTGGGIVPRLRAIARPCGITLGIAFQVMLWITLHVPTIFLFLFPPMMLLFIAPERIVERIEARQQRHAAGDRGLLLYDGNCGFCLESVKRVRVLDVFGWVDPLNFHLQPDLTRLSPALTPQRARSEIILIEPNGRVSGGFEAFQRLTRRLPSLWVLAPLVHLPGAGWIGGRVYRWVAEHRYLLHRNPICVSNQCAVEGHPPEKEGDPSQN